MIIICQNFWNRYNLIYPFTIRFTRILILAMFKCPNFQFLVSHVVVLIFANSKIISEWYLSELQLKLYRLYEIMYSSHSQTVSLFILIHSPLNNNTRQKVKIYWIKQNAKNLILSRLLFIFLTFHRVIKEVFC